MLNYQPLLSLVVSWPADLLLQLPATMSHVNGSVLSGCQSGWQLKMLVMFHWLIIHGYVVDMHGELLVFILPTLPSVIAFYTLAEISMESGFCQCVVYADICRVPWRSVIQQSCHWKSWFFNALCGYIFGTLRDQT